jgi:hypothetical protein
MPGSEMCGRCGTSMLLATATINVHPPRAGRISRRMRRVLSPRGSMNRAAAVVERFKEALPGSKQAENTLVVEPLLVRLVVPGWSQLYSGEHLRGRIFLWTWIGLIGLGLILFGSVAGSLLLGLAVSVHSSAGMDVIARYIDQPTFVRRMIYTMAFFALIALAIYVPAQRALTYFAEPFTVMTAAGDFETGDILLVSHAAFWRHEPEPGQLVYFDAGQHRIMGNHAYFDYAGYRFDRILAGPGSKVSWHNGRLTVNGAPSALRPINPARLPPSIDIQVPADRYLIFPTTVPWMNGWEDSLWSEFALIPRDQIEGVVYLRKQPLLRMKVLR